jgi:hypothetical protein
MKAVLMLTKEAEDNYLQLQKVRIEIQTSALRCTSKASQILHVKQ